jgi:hypothetical protein
MNFSLLQAALNRVLDPSTWILKSARIICIALAFEFALWWLNRFLERQTAPMLNADTGREASWRMRRRAALRQMPRNFGRSILYTVGFLLVLHEFGAPVLPLSLAIGAVVALFASGLVPVCVTFRKATRSWQKTLWQSATWWTLTVTSAPSNASRCARRNCATAKAALTSFLTAIFRTSLSTIAAKKKASPKSNRVLDYLHSRSPLCSAKFWNGCVSPGARSQTRFLQQRRYRRAGRLCAR